MTNQTNKYVTPVGLQQPAAADLSDGTTGTGTVVLAGSPALTGTPTVPTATPLTNNTQIASTAYADASSSAAAVTASAPNPSRSIIVEEFTGGLNSDGQIGQNGWRITTIGSVPVVAGTQAIYPNLGIITFATAIAATAGQGGCLSLEAGASIVGTLVNNLQGTTGWEIQYIFKLSQTTDTRFRCGVDTTFTALAGTTGLYCRYDTNATFGDTTFVFESSNAGVKTSIDSTIAVDTNWHRVKITSSVAGTAIFTLYNGSGVVQATKSLAISISTANGVSPAVFNGTNATAQKTVQLDYFSFYYPNISR